LLLLLFVVIVVVRQDGLMCTMMVLTAIGDREGAIATPQHDVKPHHHACTT
jgi:hypothetical protein